MGGAGRRAGLIKLKMAVLGILTWPLAFFPRALGLALGGALGRLAFYLWGRRRRVALGNMELIRAGGFLPPDFPARAAARKAFANHGRCAWEIIQLYHRGLAPFKSDCLVAEGRAYMEEALAETRRSGRGLLLVTGHAGNWEIMCHYAALLFGFRLHIVGRETGDPLADALTLRLRTLNGALFLAKDGSARAMLGALKAGGVVGTLIDQAATGGPPHSAAEVPFMGRPATFNLGPLRLARRAGAAVVMTLFRREGRRHYMHILPPLAPAPELPEEGDYQAKAARLNEWLGDFIRRYPDQWMWGHRRWKTRAGLARDPKGLT